MAGQRDGTVVHRDDGSTRISFNRSYPHPIEDVWKALVTPARLAQWWAEADEFDAHEGGRVHLRWLNHDAEGWAPEATGTVTAFRAPWLLELDTDAQGALRFELVSESDEAVRLLFTATRPLDVAYEAKMLAGWHWRFDALAQLLDGTPVDWAHWPRDAWLAHQRRYAEKLGWGG